MCFLLVVLGCHALNQRCQLLLVLLPFTTPCSARGFRWREQAEH
jgi:hypothetical protein